MKLWLLRPMPGLTDDNPWDPWYDKAFGFIVRAETEEQARAFAHDRAGDENRGEFLEEKIANTKEPWKNAKYSSCIELTSDGDAEVIMKDFMAA
jgi:hypothetical protein